jgi:DNA-binding CsgD family transcriptional regulator/PAS domain-containing protein
MLPREGKLAHLLGLLYEGTTDDNAWNPFLREVATAVGGESAAFMLGNADLDLHLISHHWGQDPEGIRLYTEHYGKMDVWAAKAQHIPTAEWLGPSEALCPLDELARTEFFNDFLLRFEAVHGLFGAVQDLGGMFSNLSIFRRHKRGPFEQEAVNLLRFLSPHIARAYRIHFQLADLKAHSLSLQAALDSSPTAIMLLGRDSRVIAMNLAARTIIDRSDGLLVRHGRLQTERGNESAILENLLSQAGPKRGKKPGLAGAMVVHKRNHAALHVRVTSAGKLPLALENRVTTIVFVNDLEQRARPSHEVLNSLFKLTPAESRVALLLTDGHSTREITEMIGVKISTLKSQLSSIYRKTSTSRQSELMRLLTQFAVRED